jgi:hypothetical protein
METLLTSYGDTKIPREEWGAAEWRSYALFLEESGKDIVRDLTRFESELQDARRKLSRRKPNSRIREPIALLGLLTERERAIRGRKPTGAREALAAEVLAIRAELEAEGRKMTDMAALGEYFARKGMRRSRATEHRNLLNAISEYRRSHKISKR